MKHSYTVLVTSLLLALSSATIAAERTIEVSASSDELLTLYGGAFDKPHILPMTDIQAGNNIALGGIGIQSNVDGVCTVKFSTTNTYRLINTTGSNSGTVLTDFSLLYNGKTFNKESSGGKNMGSCNVSQIPLTLIPDTVVGDIPAGTYKDIITVTVTSSS